MATFPYPENVESFMDFIRYTNDNTQGLLGIGLLIMIGLISFFTTKAYSYERAFAFSGFLLLIFGIFLRFLNLISDTALFVCIVAFIFSIILLFKERGAEEGV